MFKITRNGYNKLQEELNHLLTVERPRAVELLENSRIVGDADSDDTDFLFAVEEQDKVENRISYIGSLINDCEVFEPKDSYDTVEFGATITLLDCNTKKELTYTIVSSIESNPTKGLISIEAPIIKDLLGASIGDYAFFNDKEYELISIK